MKEHLRYGLYFLLCGPIFGWLVLAIALPIAGLLTNGLNGAQNGVMGSMIVMVYGWVFMHVIGAGPAFLTGLLVSVFGGDKQARIASAMISGAVTVWIIGWILLRLGLLSDELLLSLIGIGVAAGALTVAWKHRRRHV